MWEPWVRSLGWEVPWRRERLPTAVFWPGEFHGLYSPWGCKESDRTEWLSHFHFPDSLGSFYWRIFNFIEILFSRMSRLLKKPSKVFLISVTVFFIPGTSFCVLQFLPCLHYPSVFACCLLQWNWKYVNRNSGRNQAKMFTGDMNEWGSEERHEPKSEWSNSAWWWIQ